MFGDGAKARSLHACVDKTPALTDLQKKITGIVRTAGIDLPRRRFVPHVTLARLKGVAPDALARHISAHGLFTPLTFTAVAVTLYESVLDRDGSVYTALETYP